MKVTPGFFVRGVPTSWTFEGALEGRPWMSVPPNPNDIIYLTKDRRVEFMGIEIVSWTNALRRSLEVNDWVKVGG